MPKQSSYPTKATPVAGDKVLITDSESSNAPKQVTLASQPISTAEQTALDLKANLAGGNTFTGVQDLSANGAYFGAAAASNLLNDYEEGTWTPTLSGTTGGTYTYTTQSGSYTKIGRLVFLKALIVWTGETVAPSGIPMISGLPFSSANDGIASFGVVGNQTVGIYVNGSYKNIAIGLEANDNRLFISQRDETITSGNNYDYSPTVLTTGTLAISLVYEV